ncbi:carbohydrate ABC transporter permease [Alloscardovia venturai]|uniref:Carbohydrate ABC transporter permease n=1 Tax=Alloscardovia venturai TaxID=1769421 RepID=A0ABW2Y7W1_9BIFI
MAQIQMQTQAPRNVQSSENRKAIVRARVGHVLTIILLIILLLAFIWPFWMVLTNAFKSMNDITGEPLSVVGSHGFTLTNFTNAMRKMHFWRVFGNSAIITTFATILTILLSAMAAYVIVRNPKWGASKVTFAAMVASMVIPFQVIMVPLVSVYGGYLGVLNSRITLILMHVGFSVSLAVFMFHGAIKTNVPVELEEAAEIDGASKWRTFWTVVFPLLKPTAATVAIIDAMAFWNDYLLPSLVLTDKKLYTIPIATQVFYGTYSTDIGLVMAALLLAMLPILILYLALQRFIVAGVTAGAVKG